MNLTAAIAALQPVVNPTKTFPGGDLTPFLPTLKPGDVVTLQGTCFFSDAIRSGTKITLQGGIITGRLDIRGPVQDFTFQGVTFDDSQTLSGPNHYQSWVVGGTRIKFVQCSMTNSNTKIGLEFIQDSTYGIGTDCVVDRCHIYKIGELPCTNYDHGIYDGGLRTLVTDSVIEGCSDRGIQCRGGTNCVYTYVLVQGCGEGIIFGDAGSSGCTISKSVLLNNQVTSRYLVEQYGANSNNLVDTCYVKNQDGRPGVQPNMQGVTVTNPQSSATGLGPRFPVGV